MKYFRTTMIATLSVVGLSASTLAHTGATGIVMMRMEAMKGIGDSMKTIAAMMKGETEYDGAVVATAATIIAEHAKHIPQMFPEGSTEKPTEALPIIWTEWDRFTELANELNTDALALAEAGKKASTAQDIRAELGAVGRSCKACHQDFRMAK
jgi:cytochrome c556